MAGSVTGVCTLRFDRQLTRPNTWHIAENQQGIEARIRMASGPEVTLSIAMRWRRAKAHGLVYVRQVDETTFVTESAVLDPSLSRMELVLLDAPAEAAAVLRTL